MHAHWLVKDPYRRPGGWPDLIDRHHVIIEVCAASFLECSLTISSGCLAGSRVNLFVARMGAGMTCVPREAWRTRFGIILSAVTSLADCNTVGTFRGF